MTLSSWHHWHVISLVCIMYTSLSLQYNNSKNALLNVLDYPIKTPNACTCSARMHDHTCMHTSRCLPACIRWQAWQPSRVRTTQPEPVAVTTALTHTFLSNRGTASLVQSYYCDRHTHVPTGGCRYTAAELDVTRVWKGRVSNHHRLLISTTRYRISFSQ